MSLARRENIERLARDLRRLASSPRAVKEREQIDADLDALTALGGADAARATLEALAFDDEETEKKVLAVVETVRDKSLVKPLTAMIEDKDTRRRFRLHALIAHAFAAIGDVAALEPLADLLRSEDPKVVAAAADACVAFKSAPHARRVEPARRLIEVVRVDVEPEGEPASRRSDPVRRGEGPLGGLRRGGPTGAFRRSPARRSSRARRSSATGGTTTRRRRTGSARSRATGPCVGAGGRVAPVRGARSRAGYDRAVRASRTAAGRKLRGKSGLHRAGWWVTPTGRKPRDSATENKPPMAPDPQGPGDQARAKRRGKSPPRRRRRLRHGKPHPEKDHIGTERPVARPEARRGPRRHDVRVGRWRPSATTVVDRWRSRRKPHRTRLTARSNTSAPRPRRGGSPPGGGAVVAGPARVSPAGACVP